jgi:pimeloyl-ACP methyl ester carboxylesterase
VLEAHARRVARDYADDDEFASLYMQGFPFFLRATAMPRLASFDLRPDLPRIAAETLIVNGELDAARAGEQELLDGIGTARLTIVEEAGHFPWVVEQPQRFRDAVLPLLSA